MGKQADDEFSEFVVANWHRIFRTAYLLTGDHHHSEDLTQVAFSKAYLSWSRVRTLAHPCAYVRKVAVNETISWRRRRMNRESPTLDFQPDTEMPGPDTSVPGSLTLWRAVLALPARQRAVIVLRYYEDLSEAEIAEELGMSTGTVKSTASAARQRLARQLGPHTRQHANGGNG
jgi:RNA polymerase sigma-70 factor (sigma-E family)